MSKKIPLTQGKFAIVDDEDYEWLNQFKWCAHRIYNNYYAERRVNGRLLYMHREIMKPPKGKQVDHRNSDCLDNRGCNLRICTHQENLCNQKIQEGKSSKYKGVSWHRQREKWVASIHHNDRKMHIGCFIDEHDAARAYDKQATELFGEFARLNIIPCAV